MYNSLPIPLSLPAVVIPASGDSLTIASINATILAILFAAVGLWAANVLANRDRLTHEAIEMANLVNGIQFHANHTVDTIPILQNYDPKDEKSREALAAEMELLLAGDNDDPPEEKAEQLWLRMSVLLGSYPFATRIRLGEQGKPPLESAVVDVPFNDLSDVRNWSKAMAPLRGHFLGWQHFLSDQIQSLFDALSKQSPFSMANLSATGDMGRMLDAMSPRNIPASLRGALAQADQVHDLVTRKLGELDRYGDRLPSRRRLIVPVLLGVGTFAVGVLVPVLWRDAPSWLYAWLPAGIYLVLLASVVAWLWKRYQP